jgi:hypothetical protein
MKHPKYRKRIPCSAASGMQTSPMSPVSHPEPRTPEEQKLLEVTLQRERALLWTDNRPFSIWKS